MWDINFATTLINQEETIIISYLLISHKILYVAFLLFITYSQQSPVVGGEGFWKTISISHINDCLLYLPNSGIFSSLQSFYFQFGAIPN